jgi:hypothetical protein
MGFRHLSLAPGLELHLPNVRDASVADRRGSVLKLQLSGWGDALWRNRVIVFLALNDLTRLIAWRRRMASAKAEPRQP